MENRHTYLQSRQYWPPARPKSMLLEGLLCLLLLGLLLLLQIYFIDFKVRVADHLAKWLGHYLAMHENEVAGEPVTHVESEVWVKFFHLPVASKWRETTRKWDIPSWWWGHTWPGTSYSCCWRSLWCWNSSHTDNVQISGWNWVSELNYKKDRKTYHIEVVLSLCDTSNLHNLGLPPSRMSVFIFAALFTSGLIDPAVDPAHVYFTIFVDLIVTIVVVVNMFKKALK